MNVHLSDEKITTTKGMEVDLICSTDSEALGCSFKSPAEHNYNMLRYDSYITHFYNTKLNLISKFFTKTGFFRQNK